ncbi:MAG: hypothetical protein CVT86_02155, partial [Alphaproteobacteria bacterium HGW-Alphaproteobacteria-8]
MQPCDPILELLDFDDAQVFAVVDGAMVEDLPSTAMRHNLSTRALYYDHQSHIANANGPHLIHCADDSVIVTVRNAFPAQGVVWWVWAEADEGQAKAAIFRHLRGLGMVEIPEAYPAPPRLRAPMERVIFRHADARVMARVLPVLEPDQRARLFGKTGALVLEVEGKQKEDCMRFLRDIATMPNEEIDKLQDISYADFIHRYDVPPQVYSFLTACWGDPFLVVPPDVMSAWEVVITRQKALRNGSGYEVEGGAGKIAELFTDSVIKNGGTVMMNTYVEKIIVEDGKATGVATNKGTFKAPIIISNAGIQPTVLKLVG